MAFGTGSAIAHRAVGAVAESFSGDKDKNTHAAPAAPAPEHQPQIQNSPCAEQYTMFANCLKMNPNNMSACDTYMESLNSCKAAQSSSYN